MALPTFLPVGRSGSEMGGCLAGFPLLTEGVSQREGRLCRVTSLPCFKYYTQGRTALPLSCTRRLACDVRGRPLAHSHGQGGLEPTYHNKPGKIMIELAVVNECREASGPSVRHSESLHNI